MDSFRTALRKATASRIEDGMPDWSAHSVDYSFCKMLLAQFAQRRARLQVALQDSIDGCITGDELAMAVAIPAATPPIQVPPSGTGGGTKAPPDLLTPADLATSYIPLVESSSNVSNVSLGSNNDDPGDLGDKSNQRFANRAVMRRVTNAERAFLFFFITQEMDKVAQFYHSQWQRLFQEFKDIVVQSGGSNQRSSADVGMSVVGREILELFAFCAINIITVYQILIRYDAFARTFGSTPAFHFFMKQSTKRSNRTMFRMILLHDELKTLAENYCHELTNPVEWNEFGEQRRFFASIMNSTYRDKALGYSDEIRDSLIQLLRDYFLMGGIEDRLGLQPNLFTLRGASLTPEINQLAEWRHNRKPSQIPKSLRRAKLSYFQLYCLGLNLLSAFLYCMNYYIVEPTSTMYVNVLGATDAMSGTLIGMTPLAAFVSAIPFSIWSNHSFRHPFIASGALLILGNIMYAKAFNFGSLEMALAGRFLIGLGAPKCIVRRYMADTTPISFRTSANAGFGMAVAVGSAIGPAIAIALCQLNNFENLSATLPVLGTVFLNGLTGPGYFMAMLWTAFFLIVVITFYETDRQGLEEQKLKEAEFHSDQPPAENPCLHSPPVTDETVEQKKVPGAFQASLEYDGSRSGEEIISQDDKAWCVRLHEFSALITLPVRICLGLLFAKVFTIEALVSATSALTKNRYGWKVQQVGTLGCINGLLVIPLSIAIGGLSMRFQDRDLMTWLVTIGCIGMFLLIDLSDLIAAPTTHYNEGNPFAVSPARYVTGYFLAYVSIQSFEGVIGSALSKVIPTALATGTFNSGLLATLVDTFGRACGDLFISLVGFINIRQLMDLLFIPGFLILSTCLYIIRFQFYDVLAV